jgi:hypothetical protein
MDSRVEQLGLKLLETLHLSVLERKELPSGGIPFSALIAGVSARLADTGWFPAPVGDGDELWTGARLELRGSEFWVHERYEVGVMRVGPVRARRVRSIEEGVQVLLVSNVGESADGVRINWNA